MDSIAQTIRPELLTLSAEQLKALSPYFWVFGGTVLTILASVLRMVKPKWPVFVLTLATSVAGICAFACLMKSEPILLFNGMMVADVYSSFFGILFLASVLLTTLASFRYLDREKLQHPEYYVLILFSAIGMMLMASALDLIVLFIALELMSLAVYTLVGFRRADRRSNEAAMKYFILGSAASAVLLYGAALLYGTTGSTGIHAIFKFIQANPQGMTPVFTIGVWLVLLGFLFKVASVPFHMWMPDVYEGAPAPITGFMTTGLKAAAFAAFLRVFISLGYGKGLTAVVQSHIHDIIWVSAVLTMVVGNVVALTQTNLKRMLAYSSIAHSGYLLVGMLAGSGSEQGYGPVAMYLVVYSIMNLGAFVVLSALASRDDSGLNLHDLSGLSRRHPWMAFAMAVFLFSMAGIPPTAGFAAKYLLFYSAIQAGEISLVIISVLCSAISVYYYLRVLVYMYMRDPVGAPSGNRVSVWSTLAVASMVALTIQIGVLPARMVSAAKKAVTSL
jgi:NADH-quinone oxidoreductase subunit N